MKRFEIVDQSRAMMVRRGSPSKKEKVETKMSYGEPNDVERVSKKSMFVTIDEKKRKHRIEMRGP